MGIAGKSSKVSSIVAALAAAALVFLIAGCTSTTPLSEHAGTMTKDTDKYSAIDKATATSRTITFPKIYFGNSSTDDAVSSLQNGGCTDVKANDDGSITATMPIDKYNELVDKVYDGVKQQLDGMPADSSYNGTISSVTYDDTMGNITVTLTGEKMGLTTMFVPYVVGTEVCMYQEIAGLPVNCVVKTMSASGSELATTTLPQDAEKLSQMGNATH